MGKRKRSSSLDIIPSIRKPDEDEKQLKLSLVKKPESSDSDSYDPFYLENDSENSDGSYDDFIADQFISSNVKDRVLELAISDRVEDLEEIISSGNIIRRQLNTTILIQAGINTYSNALLRLSINKRFELLNKIPKSSITRKMLDDTCESREDSSNPAEIKDINIGLNTICFLALNNQDKILVGFAQNDLISKQMLQRVIIPKESDPNKNIYNNKNVLWFLFHYKNLESIEYLITRRTITKNMLPKNKQDIDILKYFISNNYWQAIPSLIKYNIVSLQEFTNLMIDTISGLKELLNNAFDDEEEYTDTLNNQLSNKVQNIKKHIYRSNNITLGGEIDDDYTYSISINALSEYFGCNNSEEDVTNILIQHQAKYVINYLIQQDILNLNSFIDNLKNTIDNLQQEINEELEVIIEDDLSINHEHNTPNNSALTHIWKGYNIQPLTYPGEEIGIIHKVKGDGNCLFRSIACSLLRGETLSQDHENDLATKLREQACDYIRSHRNDYIDFIPPDLNQGPDEIIPSQYKMNKYLEDYIESMRKPVLNTSKNKDCDTSAWGDEIMLNALCKALDRNIVVFVKPYTNNNNNIQIYNAHNIKPSCANKASGDIKKSISDNIYLFSVPEVHYDSIELNTEIDIERLAKDINNNSSNTIQFYSNNKVLTLDGYNLTDKLIDESTVTTVNSCKI